MWIKNQEKTKLLKCCSFTVAKVFGGKLKASITAQIDGSAGFGEVLGQYGTIEDAKLELERIQEAIENNPNKVYEMN